MTKKHVPQPERPPIRGLCLDVGDGAWLLKLLADAAQSVHGTSTFRGKLHLVFVRGERSVTTWDAPRGITIKVLPDQQFQLEAIGRDDYKARLVVKLTPHGVKREPVPPNGSVVTPRVSVFRGVMVG